MSLAEVLPAVQTLSRVEKLNLIQVLAEELVRSENVPALEAGHTYPIWSPYDAYQGAEVLLQLLEREKSKQ